MVPEITIIKSNRKTIGIEVSEKGIIVRAPKRASKQDVLSFVSKNEDWIKKHLVKLEIKKKEFENIKKLSDDEINDLKMAALEYFPKIAEYYAKKMNVSYNRISVGIMKSRWGSCSSKKSIKINILLMLAPEDVRKAIVVHELTHLKYMNHSKQFYEELLKHFPEYYECNKWLKDNGNKLMHMYYS